jgi:integral membrane protein (TIGR00529 family)
MGWVGFLLAMASLLIISQKNLGVAMFVSAFILGIFTIPEALPSVMIRYMFDPSTILLAATVGLIPLIGGTLNETGQIDKLIRNMRIGKKPFLMLSPALIGLLPMPGGALLSAPIVDKAGRGLSKENKTSINVWFRHVLYLVYPISANFIVSTAAARIGLYQPIPYLMILLLFSLLLGYFFFLRGDLGQIEYEEKFSLKDLALPLTALLIAPFIDVLLKTLRVLPLEEIGTLIAVAASLAFSIAISHLNLRRFVEITAKARPWNFAFMMMGIMVFLGVFKNSVVLELFKGVPMNPEILYVIAVALGFMTGRMITPAGIVFPIYLTKFGEVSALTFSLIYFGIFLGYVLTPVHPCVSLTAESLEVELKEYLKTVVPPVAIGLAVSLIVLHFVSL